MSKMWLYLHKNTSASSPRPPIMGFALDPSGGLVGTMWKLQRMGANEQCNLSRVWSKVRQIRGECRDPSWFNFSVCLLRVSFRTDLRLYFVVLKPPKMGIFVSGLRFRGKPPNFECLFQIWLISEHVAKFRWVRWWPLRMAFEKQMNKRE